MNIMPDMDEFIPWAGKTRGDMVGEILEYEKRTGKDKELASLTHILEMIARDDIKRMTKPVKCWNCGKDTIAMAINFGGCLSCMNKPKKRGKRVKIPKGNS